MQSETEIEEKLYSDLSRKNTDRDFLGAFIDYFDFLLSKKTRILDPLLILVGNRNTELNLIKERETVLIEKMSEMLTKNLSKDIKVLKLSNNPVVIDRLNSITSILDGSSTCGTNIPDALHDEVFDIFNEMLRLGFKDVVSKYCTLEPDGRYIKIINGITKEVRNLNSELKDFEHKDNIEVRGTLVRLSDVYRKIKSLKSEHKAFVEKEQRTTQDIIKRIVTSPYLLELENILEGKNTGISRYFSKEKLLPDIERMHNYIITNYTPSEEDKTSVSKNDNKVFYINDNNEIYHYKEGLMKYEKNGLKDPKYIKMFRDVILYMPDGRKSVSDFEKLLGKKNKHGASTYRNNLGESTESFNGFFKKNKVKNIHPKTKSKVIKVTKAYIDFHNEIK